MHRIHMCKESCTITDIFSLYVIQCMDRKDILCIADFYPKRYVSLFLCTQSNIIAEHFIFFYTDNRHVQLKNSH